MNLNQYIKSVALLCVAAITGFSSGCSRNDRAAAPLATAHHHEHKPPHGGALVELGEEEYHLEFVLDAAAGRLQAFVMDGELENFVRIDAPSLDLTVRVSGRDEKLLLQPVANHATGETAGDTSLFEAQADWLKATPGFDGVLEQITVRGKTYRNISFNIPKGGDEGSKH